MEKNIENILVEAKVNANQTSIFIVDYIKIPKTSAFQSQFFFPGMFTSLLVTILRQNFTSRGFFTKSLPIILHEIRQ